MKTIKERHLGDLFSFMVDAAKDFYEAGSIPEPAGVKAATEAGFDDMDTFLQFIEAECEVDRTNDRLRTKRSSLWSAYKNYETANRLAPICGSRGFRMLLNRHKLKILKSGEYYVLGIEIKPKPSEPEGGMVVG